MPVYEADDLQPSRASAATLSTARVFLAYDSNNKFNLPSAGGVADGVQRYAASATGDEVTIETDGNMLVLCSGTFSIGDEVMTDAAGKALKWAGCAEKLGLALSAGSNGQLALIKFYDRAQKYPLTRAGNTASAAGVVVIPAGDYFHVTGALAITGWTNPAGIQDGARMTTIPDGAFTWTAAGNIAVAGTAVVSRAIDWIWDATTVKWYPSYV